MLKWIFIICLFVVLPYQKVNAKKISSRDSVCNINFFDSNKLLEFNCISNYELLLNDISKDRKYHKCRFILTDESSSKKIDLQVKTRGNFRRQKKNCNFPPLKFKFKSDNAKNTIFEGQKKIKYVTHCMDNSRMYEQKIIQEYLIYKIYNIISPYSFKVRLCKVNHIDYVKRDSIQKFGFFIENKKFLASRNGMLDFNSEDMLKDSLDRASLLTTCLFQMMVGNSDWCPERGHNVVFIKSENNSKYIPVVYDYDWAEIVGNKYYVARPSSQIFSKSHVDRPYIGFKWKKDELIKEIEYFNQIKSEIIDLIIQFPYLKASHKRKFVNYILDFYEILDDNSTVKTLVCN
jgi:hypothetical protein